MYFGVTNGPSPMTRATKLAYSHTINSTKQNSTQKFPLYLLRGYKPRHAHELPIESFLKDMLHEHQLDLLTWTMAEAANSVQKTHLENKRRYDLHRISFSFKSVYLALNNWPKQGDHKLYPIVKVLFVVVHQVALYATRSSL
ncbi:hypothetical protein NPIL_572131 [Nephila pilipes]|uniref:Uncharacterized protein n=1 Tax=Nephila pilipes TaxID=299642 RepID=A0A8X6TGD7_NEPPI|nr:hypothetical protein NPIL_572131 [Nephila pilipes]